MEKALCDLSQSILENKPVFGEKHSSWRGIGNPLFQSIKPCQPNKAMECLTAFQQKQERTYQVSG